MRCQSTLRIVSRRKAKLKVKQMPGSREESVVHVEVCQPLKSSINLLVHSSRSMGNMCFDGV